MFSSVIEEAIGLPDSELRERIRCNELARRELDAELAALVAEAERRSLATRVDGHRSTIAFLRAELNCSTSDAAQWRSQGRTVARLDGVGDAWASGRIGRGQVRRIAEARSNPRVRDSLAPFLPTLIAQAEILEAADFSKLVDHTVDRIDPDGAHDDRDHAIEHRRAGVSTVGGSLHISAFGGDGPTAAEMQAIFERFDEAEYARDVAARAELHPVHTDEHDLPRTSSQRRHDALVAIFRAAAVSNGDGAAADLVLNIVVDADTFGAAMHDAGLASDTNLAGDRVDPFTGVTRPSEILDEFAASAERVLDRRCETTTGVELHPHDVVRAALSGHVRRIVVDSAGTVIDQGRKQRLFTGSARTAAMMLARTCEHPGCRTPARFSQVDHADEWARHEGRTDQANGRIGCGPHNRAKSEHRWRARRGAHGRSYTIREDGSIMLPVGARTPDLDSAG